MQVMDRAQWDEEQEVWMLQQLPKAVTKRPISTAQHRRPVTAYAQAAVALGDHNPRYKTDNILALALDMPDRTTADYSGSQVQTQVCTDSNAASRFIKIWAAQNACTLSCAAWCSLLIRCSMLASCWCNVVTNHCCMLWEELAASDCMFEACR